MKLYKKLSGGSQVTLLLTSLSLIFLFDYLPFWFQSINMGFWFAGFFGWVGSWYWEFWATHKIVNKREEAERND